MLKDLLEERNISVYRLSQLAKVPYSTLSDLVSGRTSISSISAGTLARISEAMNISLDELYYGKKDKKLLYLYNEGREIHILFEEMHFRFLGPKNLIAFKSINRIADGCVHVNTYYSDGKVIYLEEEFVDIKGEFEEYGCIDRYPSDMVIKLGRPDESSEERIQDDALMICDNMAILTHFSSTEDIEIEIINMTRLSSRMVMRLKDYRILSSSMSDTMQKKALSVVKRNDSLISVLADEGSNTYA